MRRYVSARVATSTLESVTLFFGFTNKYKYIIWVRRRFSVAGARNALHGWCAWCRAPLSSRTSLTFSSRCASIREPTCHRTHLRPISKCTGRSLLPSSWGISHSHARHWTLTRLVLHLPLPPFPRHSFSPRRSSWRHFEVPSSPSSRRTARTTGSSSSRCSCARRSSCTATTSKLGTFLFIYYRMGNWNDNAVFYLFISSQGE